MNKLLKKIYNEVLIYERDIVKHNAQVDKEINSLIEPYINQISANELDKLKEMLSVIGLTAEQTGFENGVRFTLKMLYALLND